MAGFSDYSKNMGHSQHHQNLEYLQQNQYRPYTDYQHGTHGHTRSAGIQSPRDNFYGATARPYSMNENYPSENHPRSLRMSISTPPCSGPESPEDPVNAKNYAQKSISLLALVADNLLSHPFIVLRRQCQVHVQSTRYHMFPISLIGPSFYIAQRQGFGVLWKGLGSSLLIRGMTLAVEDVTSKITPLPKEINRHSTLKAMAQHILLKSISFAVITPFYSASLVETVQSEVASETAGFFDVFREGLWRLLSWPNTGRIVPLHTLIIPTVAHGILSYLIYTGIKSVSLSTIRRVRENKERKQGALSKEVAVSYYLEMTSSLIGNIIADMLLYPLETILHRLHLQGTRTIIDNLDSGIEVTPIITSYDGVFDCIRTIIDQEGTSGLYKGFGALILQYGLNILLIRMVKIALDASPFSMRNKDSSNGNGTLSGNGNGNKFPHSRSDPSMIKQGQGSEVNTKSPTKETREYSASPRLRDPTPVSMDTKLKSRLTNYDPDKL